MLFPDPIGTLNISTVCVLCQNYHGIPSTWLWQPFRSQDPLTQGSQTKFLEGHSSNSHLGLQKGGTFPVNFGNFSEILENFLGFFGKFPPLCNPTQTCLEVYSNPEDLAYLDQVCLISVGAKPSPGIEFETNALAIRCQCKSKWYLQSQEPSLAQQIPHVYCKKWQSDAEERRDEWRCVTGGLRSRPQRAASGASSEMTGRCTCGHTAGSSAASL